MCAPVSALSLAAQEESRIEEGYQPPDYVHVLIAIPPKYAVSQGGRLHDRAECHPTDRGFITPHGGDEKALDAQKLPPTKTFFSPYTGRREYIIDQDAEVTDWSS